MHTDIDAAAENTEGEPVGCVHCDQLAARVRVLEERLRYVRNAAIAVSDDDLDLG